MQKKSILPGQMALSRLPIGKLRASTVVKIADVTKTDIYISIAIGGGKEVYSLSREDFDRDFLLMKVFAGEITNVEPAKSNANMRGKHFLAPNLYLKMGFPLQ